MRFPGWAEIAVFVRRHKTQLILLLLLPFLLLLLLPSRSKEEPSEPRDVRSYETELEAELEDLLMSVEGVGKCRVKVTFSDEGETVYAYDESSSSSQGSAPRVTEEKEYVLISSRNEGLVLKVYPPSVRGVAVVCSGGGSTRVKSDVTEILSRILGISSDRIAVKKSNF